MRVGQTSKITVWVSYTSGTIDSLLVRKHSEKTKHTKDITGDLQVDSLFEGNFLQVFVANESDNNNNNNNNINNNTGDNNNNNNNNTGDNNNNNNNTTTTSSTNNTNNNNNNDNNNNDNNNNTDGSTNTNNNTSISVDNNNTLNITHPPPTTPTATTPASKPRKIMTVVKKAMLDVATVIDLCISENEDEEESGLDIDYA